MRFLKVLCTLFVLSLAALGIYVLIAVPGKPATKVDDATAALLHEKGIVIAPEGVNENYSPVFGIVEGLDPIDTASNGSSTMPKNLSALLGVAVPDADPAEPKEKLGNEFETATEERTIEIPSFPLENVEKSEIPEPESTSKDDTPEQANEEEATKTDSLIVNEEESKPSIPDIPVAIETTNAPAPGSVKPSIPLPNNSRIILDIPNIYNYTRTSSVLEPITPEIPTTRAGRRTEVPLLSNRPEVQIPEIPQRQGQITIPNNPNTPDNPEVPAFPVQPQNNPGNNFQQPNQPPTPGPRVSSAGTSKDEGIEIPDLPDIILAVCETDKQEGSILPASVQTDSVADNATDSVVLNPVDSGKSKYIVEGLTAPRIAPFDPFKIEEDMIPAIAPLENVISKTENVKKNEKKTIVPVSVLLPKISNGEENLVIAGSNISFTQQNPVPPPVPIERATSPPQLPTSNEVSIGMSSTKQPIWHYENQFRALPPIKKEEIKQVSFLEINENQLVRQIPTAIPEIIYDPRSEIPEASRTHETPQTVEVPQVFETLKVAETPQVPEIPEIPEMPKNFEPVNLTRDETNLTENVTTVVPNTTLTTPESEKTEVVIEEKKPTQKTKIRSEVVKLGIACQEMVENGQEVQGFYRLSKLYEHRNVNDEERKVLVPSLDTLAKYVIFSNEYHLLEPPYIVQAGETYESIADKYDISPELLKSINGAESFAPLRSGTVLKVVKGPFDAVISIRKKEVQLLLNGLYAGRFQTGIGNPENIPRGKFPVLELRKQPPYFGADGSVIPGGNSENPYGEYWIGIGKELGIHGTNAPETIGTHHKGATGFNLNGKDILDLFQILNTKSTVTINP